MYVSKPGSQPVSGPARRSALTLLLITALVAVGTTAFPLMDEAARVASPALGWPVLLVLFALTELVVMHIQTKREAQAVSLSELVTVLALFLAEPASLIFARVLGSVAVCVVHRRSSLIKTAFNAAQFMAETAVALWVFHLLAGSAGPPDPRSWLAALVAVLAGGAVGIVSLGLVIAVYEGGLQPRELLREAVLGQPSTVIVSGLGLVAVTCLAIDPRSGWLLGASAVGLLLAFRAYARLSDRHLSLERLYRFSQVVSSSPEMDEVLRSVLVEAKTLLRSEQVWVTFLPSGGGAGAVEIRLGPGDRLHRSTHEDDESGGWLHGQVVEGGVPVLLARGSRNADAREWMGAHDAREGVVVPLRGEAGVLGMIAVADRMGEVRPFDAGDVQLLETVANHAGVALQNGRLIDQLRHDALHDALTGLPNRVQLRRVLAEAVESVRLGNEPLAAVLVLDLDGFKDVNDTLGHAAGDRLLQHVARRLVEAVGERGHVARLGGDEFAVVMPRPADLDAVLGLGRCIDAALSVPVPLDGLEVQVGGSLGVAVTPDHGLDPTVLLKRADMAMYDAKNGSGGLRVWTPDRDTVDPRRLAMVSELRYAVAAETLAVHVQPKARLDDGTVTAVEALVRWSSPTLGNVPPDEFIPVAERSGLIGGLTAFVLDRSLAAVAQWRREGLELGIAVNLSTRSLLDPDLCATVCAALNRHGVPARLLTLEITESSVMTDISGAVALLEQLRALGVRLSLDDFGTGYSSLSYLKRLPVHELKIDRSFVTVLGLEGKARSEEATIVRAVVDLGRNLGLEVVAEGVEDAQAWALLDEMGCTLAQGWHLARPMPIEDLAGWMHERSEPRAFVPLQAG